MTEMALLHEGCHIHVIWAHIFLLAERCNTVRAGFSSAASMIIVIAATD